ncbi:MAG: hypothetical protein O2930_03845 [Acidobacteria bacterium]|nr:hypothetical protein [Acidobacteriota bacterium]
MMPTSLLTIAIVLLAAAAPARAQDTALGDARWAPWLGCWHLVQDDRGSRDRAATNSEDVVVCVLPAPGNRGVGMATYVGGQSVLQQTIVADGASRPVSEPECSGSQMNEWSLTGRQLFTRADITCTGQPARAVSAVTLMAAGPTWVDIQAVGTDQDAQVRVRRYQRTERLPQGVILPAGLQRRAAAALARPAGPTVMTLEEVVDASGKVSAPAVEAALYETGSRFDLNSRTLKALDASGVPGGVVDVMVAMSFPGHVAIDRPFRGRAQTRRATAASVRRSTRPPSYSYDPPSAYDPYYAYDPFYAYRPYSPYYFYYSPYYSPFGYSNWWNDPYRPYYSPGRRPVVVRPGGAARPGGGDGDRGRAVRGRGYTRGGSGSAPDGQPTRRDAVTDDEASSTSDATSDTSSRRAVPRRGYTNGRSSGGESRGGAGARPSGSGSGSGGSRSGRTAQPR